MAISAILIWQRWNMRRWFGYQLALDDGLGAVVAVGAGGADQCVLLGGKGCRRERREVGVTQHAIRAGIHRNVFHRCIDDALGLGAVMARNAIVGDARVVEGDRLPSRGLVTILAGVAGCEMGVRPLLECCLGIQHTLAGGLHPIMAIFTRSFGNTWVGMVKIGGRHEAGGIVTGVASVAGWQMLA